ncbi:hypothetical protein [Streptomyces sp. bgisy082]|uniref:hypothetical protein n=1 Tax=Streptomyces sp. bgisy082 TaxID=3413776 RepID=UPI003D72CB96
MFTDADVEALRSDERLIEAGLIAEDGETATARALGHHLSRLAEWQMQTLRAWLSHVIGKGGGHDRAALIEHATRLLPEMELLQGHAWRRHLTAHAWRMLAADDEHLLHRSTWKSGA